MDTRCGGAATLPRSGTRRSSASTPSSLPDKDPDRAVLCRKGMPRVGHGEQKGLGGGRVRAALPPGRRSAARRSRWHAPARCGRSSLLGAARHRRLAASPCVEGSGIGTVRNCPCRERHEQERECDACSRKQPRYTACHGATDRSGERTRPHAPASAHRGRGRRHRRRRPRCRPIRPRPRARCGRGCRGLQTVDTLSTYPH